MNERDPAIVIRIGKTRYAVDTLDEYIFDPVPTARGWFYGQRLSRAGYPGGALVALRLEDVEEVTRVPREELWGVDA